MTAAPQNFTASPDSPKTSLREFLAALSDSTTDLDALLDSLGLSLGDVRAILKSRRFRAHRQVRTELIRQQLRMVAQDHALTAVMRLTQLSQVENPIVARLATSQLLAYAGLTPPAPTAPPPQRNSGNDSPDDPSSLASVDPAQLAALLDLSDPPAPHTASESAVEPATNITPDSHPLHFPMRSAQSENLPPNQTNPPSHPKSPFANAATSLPILLICLMLLFSPRPASAPTDSLASAPPDSLQTSAFRLQNSERSLQPLSSLSSPSVPLLANCGNVVPSGDISMRKTHLASLLLALASIAQAAPLQIAGNPVELSVGAVSDRTLRLAIAPLDAAGNAKPDPATAVLVDFPVRTVARIREVDPGREFAAGPMRLSLTETQGGAGDAVVVRIQNAAGKLVQELTIRQSDGTVEFRTEAPVFGLGEGRQQMDRRGFYYNFLNAHTGLLAKYGATIPVPLLIGTDGWGLFFHNPPPRPTVPINAREANLPWCTFDLRGPEAWVAGPPAEARQPPSNNPVDVVVERPATMPTRGKFTPRKETLNQAPIQIYVMALDQPADALSEMVRLTGHAALPPKWTMGYMQSHRSLVLGEPVKVAETFREKKLPCDAVIYLGTGYTVGDSGWNTGHGSLDFNPKVFDKPAEIVDRLHALHMKVVLHENNVPTGIWGNSVNDQSDDPMNIHNYWAKHLPLVKLGGGGVDGWWPDDGDGVPIEGRFTRYQAYYEGSLRDHPNERPWTLNRNGYAGTARLGGWIWSGDVQSRWATLQHHIATGLNASISANPFWGTDTGGFFMPPPAIPNDYTGELYVRWFQFSAFNPLFRSHGRNWHLHTPFGWNTGEMGPKEQGADGAQTRYPPESEFHNADVEPICRKFLELRYALLPYNYSLVREACDTGMPPMRALWLNYGNDREAVGVEDEYLWGPNILVAPVVEKAATTRRLYLPAGQWYDWWTGEKTVGGKWIERPVDLATMPLYVRAGGIVPIDPVRQWTGEPVTEPTALRIYPGADGEFVLYDDDGHTMGYRDGSDGAQQWIRITWSDATKRATIARDARMKSWPTGTSRKFKVQLADGTPKEIEFRGEDMSVGF